MSGDGFVRFALEGETWRYAGRRLLADSSRSCGTSNEESNAKDKRSTTSDSRKNHGLVGSHLGVPFPLAQEAERRVLGARMKQVERESPRVVRKAHREEEEE